MSEPAAPTPIRRMFAELDYPVAEGRKAKILVAAIDALEPLYALLIEAGGSHRGDGESAFAMFHLAGRSLSDLVASAHLASHAYLQQAYSTMRPVLENCDLIELFAREPREAALWVNAPKPGETYRPSDVRRRLGSQPADLSEYGHLSEMGSHPRFAGSRLTGVMLVARDDPKDRKLMLRVGPFYPEHPSTVHVYLWQFQLTMRLGFKLRHLGKVSERATRELWVAGLLDTARAASRGCKLIHASLIEMGQDEDPEQQSLDTVYDEMIAVLETGGPLPDESD